ncbi:Zn(II)2Cys6 transcription factor [Candidatus Bathyarchaeota archaeon]|nr:Zn(II)2Cys6 transcription factor [Candidatus Bathyarchaeota archaeon]
MTSGTACWPCRQRKVKCDAQEPCTNCVKREHPQLCSYKPNQRSSGGKTPGAASSRSGTRKRTLSPDSAAASHGDDKRHRDSWPPRSFGSNPLFLSVSGNAPSSDRGAATSDSEMPEPARYLGQNSIPALIREQPNSSNSGDGSDIRSDMRPILGLDTSAPFPLMSTRHLDSLTRDITSELPSDREVMKYGFDPPPPLFVEVLTLVEDSSGRTRRLHSRSGASSSTSRTLSPS